MELIALALVAILVLWMGVLLAFAGSLVARWREPVLKHPVLAIESDDWGAGPLQQADALRRLTALLQRVRDNAGRPAVMTLGVVLEVPDGARIAASGCAEYHAMPLSDARFDGIRAAMHDGIESGVFAPQLHGQCHYWPQALLAAARVDDDVRVWLTAPEPAMTEVLPSPLQSRWVDASMLPSRAHDAIDIQQAVLREKDGYTAIFGQVPVVAVATTFVWNEVVEAAWAKAGIDVIISPGRRATCRDAAGRPGCIDQTMLTGEQSLMGQTYLVRDVYFEPALGHVPQRLVDGLALRTRQGRICLLETHRFNFLPAAVSSMGATLHDAVRVEPDVCFASLEQGLSAAVAAFPALRFATPEETARAIQTRNPDCIETRLGPRLAAWCARLDEIPRFRRVAQLSGLMLPLAWLRRVA